MKERLVTCNEEDTDGRARVTRDEDEAKTATNPITLYECEFVSVDLNAAYTVRPLTAFVILDTISFTKMTA